MKSLILFSVILIVFISTEGRKYKEGDCEVCVSFLKKVQRQMEDAGVDTSDQSVVENELGKACDKARKKEEKFCYYIGASSISATRLVNEVTRPLSNSVPPEKICWDKLKKKDSQICELTYDKEIDLNTVDLSKLRVKELRKILGDMGGSCNGCLEKDEFIRRIKDLHGKTEL